MTKLVIMNRLLVISIFFYMNQAARVPKIYNALITTDENLQPSQAYPLIEPVFRTTALGVAFPPLLIRPGYSHTPQLSDKPQPQNENQPQPQQGSKPQEEKPQGALLTYHNSPLYPVAYDPYLSYGYHHDLIYPTLPYYHQPIYVDVGHYQNSNIPQQQGKPVAAEDAKQVQPLPPQVEQLPQHVINFKKNPDIPDVIPPLPVTRNDGKKKRDS